MIRRMFFLLLGLLSISQGMRIIMPSHIDSNWHQTLQWKNRLIVISGSQDLVIEQRDRFMSVEASALERDVLLLTLIFPPQSDSIDEMLLDSDSIVSQFGITSSNFQVLLIGKDGQVKERRFEIIDPNDFFNRIDLMPMRVMEMQQEKTT